MDIVYVLLLWPAVVLVSALLNMLVSWSFSWSELVFDYLVGVMLGLTFVFATAPHAGPAAGFFLVMSHGLPGILFASGAIDKDQLLLVSMLMIGGCTLLAAALDRAAIAIGKTMSPGAVAFSILVFLFKVSFTPLTSAVSMLFFLVGAIRSATGSGRVGFISGVFFVEWNPTTASTAATTLGFCVQVWQGRFEEVIEHELYHSRQYIYLHDWLIPAWLCGGIWGLISAAIGGSPSMYCFQAARFDREMGNPIERAAYKISGYNGRC